MGCCPGNGGNGDAAVDGDELPLVSGGQGQHVPVGDLTVPQRVLPFDGARRQQAEIVGPEVVLRVLRGLGKPGRYGGWRQCPGVGRLRHDADAAVLRDGARRPALVRVVHTQRHPERCQGHPAGPLRAVQSVSRFHLSRNKLPNSRNVT